MKNIILVPIPKHIDPQQFKLHQVFLDEMYLNLNTQVYRSKSVGHPP
jgi:hypothetical protein